MPPPKLQVLLALRDPASVAVLAQAWMQPEVAVALASPKNTSDLLSRLSAEPPALLVLGLEDKPDLLQQIRELYPDLPVVIVIAKPTAALAYAASRMGAEDVLTLPLDETDTTERMQVVFEKISQQAVVPFLPQELPAPAPPVSRLAAAGVPPQTTRVPAPAPPAISPPQSGISQKFAEPKGKVALESKSSSAATGAPAAFPLHSPQLIGSNPRIAEIRDIVSKVAATDATVLIRGESGVGKEIVARMVYEASRRVQKPFVKVNCAAIPNDLLESELFGYDVGAFTGATRQKPGKFELADGGTLFLDEIGEMHPLLQAKLLHVLQDGQFSRLGAKHDISVDVRVLCATNKLLEQRVAEGLFREDLYYRINVVTVHVPPLRERRDEIPLLTRYFLERYAAEYRRPLRFFSSEAEACMLTYSWPGNVRELENLCKRFVIVGGETQILRELALRQTPENTPISESSAAQSAEKTSPSSQNRPGLAGRKIERKSEEGMLSLLEIGRRAAWQAERQAIQQMLLDTRWNRKEAARRLQVSYKALLNKLKQMEREELPSEPMQGEHNAQM